MDIVYRITWALGCLFRAGKWPVAVRGAWRGRVIVMRWHQMVRIIAAGALASLLAISTVMPAGASGGASVPVTATVRHGLSVTLTEPGVLVSSNGPWSLSAEVPGSGVFVVSGDACAERLVVLPEGATAVEVYPR